MCIILDKRVLKTKVALRKALFKLLETKKITAITVTELCQKAHINRRTFYIHYEQINNIFEEYSDEIYETIVNKLSAAKSSPTILLATFDQILQANFTGFRQLCLNNAHYQLVQQLEQLLFDTLNDIFNQQGKSVNQITLAYVSAGLIKSYILWFRSNGKISSQDLNSMNRQIFATLLSPQFLK